MNKSTNGVLAKIAVALIVAAILGVFGFATTLDNRLDAHDVRMARYESDMGHMKAMLEKIDRKLEKALSR